MASATIAAELERERLEHRIGRMQLVLAALRDRDLHHRSLAGGSPPPLRQAIAGFERELSALRVRLVELAGTGP